MDPRNGVPGVPDETGHDTAASADLPAAGANGAAGASGASPASSAEDCTIQLPRAQHQPLAPVVSGPAAGPAGGGSVRFVQLVAGDYLLTLNPVDGSEVITCPPERRPAPARRTPQERAALQAAARPSVPPGPRAPELPLLEREEERERLARLLSRGRSVRVTGPSGAGRSALLDAVADTCGDLAPDGVIRLSGYRRTPSDLLQELFAITYDADGYRPDRPRLLELLSEVGAVVVLDDLEFGGPALEDLLAAAPECAFLMSATPEAAAPASHSLVEEIFLPGLTRAACLELLERTVERPLQDDEAAWAADLWFESEGLPLRFVQAGALLRRRDAQGIESLAGDEPVWSDPHDAADEPYDAVPEAPAGHIPLPSLVDSAAPAELLASWIGGSARETLRFAVALGGEVPHQAHLPALVGDTHCDAALGEVVAAGLATPVAAHYRLAVGVRQQLVGRLAAGAAAGGPDGPQAHTAAQYYAWWAGHPSITPDRVAAEAEAILAALAACRDGGHAGAAVLLARTAAPAFAAALHWSAWERSLRIGQEAARLAGDVAEEAYFHHELGVLALCTGSLGRARTELEASIALRGALADRQGSTVGRRTLALVIDRSALTGATPGAGPDASGLPGEAPATVISKRLSLPGPATSASASASAPASGPRRNLVAAGAGALLVAVLGTIVTLGTMSNGDDANTPMNVKPAETAQQDDADNSLPAAPGTPGSPSRPGPTVSGSPTTRTDPSTTGTGSGSGGGSGSTGTATPTNGDTGSGSVSGGGGGGGSSSGGGGTSSGGGSGSGGFGSGGFGSGGTTGGNTSPSAGASPSGSASGSASPSPSASSGDGTSQSVSAPVAPTDSGSAGESATIA